MCFFPLKFFQSQFSVNLSMSMSEDGVFTTRRGLNVECNVSFVSAVDLDKV